MRALFRQLVEVATEPPVLTALTPEFQGVREYLHVYDHMTMDKGKSSK